MATVVAFTCGYCGRGVNGEVVGGKYVAGSSVALQCPLCEEISGRSTKGVIHPAATQQMGVAHLPTDVHEAWLEAVTSLNAGAPTACEIMCRKILMHVAVDVANSKPGRTFVEYIDDLDTAGYISTGLKPKIDEIRNRGNIANHDLPASPTAQAENTMAVTRHLLVSVYELPNS